jgi:uncharacterized protein
MSHRLFSTFLFLCILIVIYIMYKNNMNCKLQKIGNYMQVDEDAFLVSHLGLEKLQEAWVEAIDPFVKLIHTIYPVNTHSIYVRGSVASGSAIENVSDIDFSIVTYNPVTQEEKGFIWERVNILNKQFPFITKFDVGFYSREEIFTSNERALLKLTARCVYGDDVIMYIEKLRPGKDVAITAPGLEKDIEHTLKKINEKKYTDDTMIEICRWIMKRFVRVSFEIVSEREKAFTRDLYTCWKSFSRYYPEKSEQVLSAVLLAIDPVNDSEVIKESICTLGEWLIWEAKKQNII